MKDRPPATLDGISRRLDSLSRHIESLDKSVQEFRNRIIPFDEDAVVFRGVRREWTWAKADDPPSIEMVLHKIREADAHIEAIERDFASVRTKIEDLERLDLLSEEIRPYLKPETRRR